MHSDIVAAVIKVFQDPSRWSNTYLARDKDGNKVSWENPTAKARSIMGEYWYQVLLYSKKHPLEPKTEHTWHIAYMNTVHSLIPKCADIQHWEEKATTTHTDILRVLARTYELIRVTEA